MGEIKVGDSVFDECGNICHVIAKSKIDYDEQAYRITFKDGEVIDAGARHQWCGEITYGKAKKAILTTEELFVLPKKGNSYPFRIPVANMIDTEKAELPIEPYLMGYWLGNKIPIKSFHDKIIPQIYLRASIWQRFELLQGLMDSDGTINERKGQAIYTSTEKALAESVSELLWSLGIKNAITTAVCTQRRDWSKPSSECGRTATGEGLYQKCESCKSDLNKERHDPCRTVLV